MKFLSTLYSLASYSYVRLGPKYLPQRHLLEHLLYYVLLIFLYIGSPVWNGWHCPRAEEIRVSFAPARTRIPVFRSVFPACLLCSTTLLCFRPQCTYSITTPTPHPPTSPSSEQTQWISPASPLPVNVSLPYTYWLLDQLDALGEILMTSFKHGESQFESRQGKLPLLQWITLYLNEQLTKQISK